MPVVMNPHAQELDAELDEAAEGIKAAVREAIRPEDLEQYAIRGADEDFAAAAAGAGLASGGIVSVKAKDGSKARVSKMANGGGATPKSDGKGKRKGGDGGIGGKKDGRKKKK